MIESFDRLVAFGHKWLPDKFYLEDLRNFNLRDIILKEMISNVLIHREFSSSYPAKFIIESDRMYTDNACKARFEGNITPETLDPYSKNPIIAKFFHNIGNADVLGSGTRNLFKYSRLYSGEDPTLIENDIFRIIVPLNDSYSYDKDGVKSKKVHLSLNQENILSILAKNPRFTAQDLIPVMGINIRNIEKNIKYLREAGFLKRGGSDKKW